MTQKNGNFWKTQQKLKKSKGKKKLLTEIDVLHALQNATPSHSAEHATHTQGDTKERELLKCVVVVKECVRGGGRHLQDVIFKHW